MSTTFSMKCTYQKYCISWIINNSLATFLLVVVPKIDQTINIMTSKGEICEVNITETMWNKYYEYTF